MNHVFYMAIEYLRFHWRKTASLIASISLILFLPAGLHVVVEKAARELTARAKSTPLLLGPEGSAVDLTLAALYFRDSELDSIDFDESKRVTETGLATGIPLRVRHKVQTQPIVGTTIDYFAFRELETARGRLFGMLGECVVGAEAAETLQADVGSDLFSSPSGAFDVAGSFPLKMKVVGVLEPAGTPDDKAVFVDIKTAWVIEGLAHGHDDLSAPEADDALLSREGGVAVASAAVLTYTEITPVNIDSFHFHGDPDSCPFDAVVVAPKNRRSAFLMQGR